jgi:hypothetical protein
MPRAHSEISAYSQLQRYVEVGWKRQAPDALSLGKSPGTHRTGGWDGPRAGLETRKSVAPSRVNRRGRHIPIHQRIKS